MAKTFCLADHISAVAPVSESDTKRRVVEMLPVQKILANEMNFYDVSDVDDLINSILTHGLLEPIVVRRADDDKYVIISGHRRYRAWMTILNDKLCEEPTAFVEIPCFVVKPKDELVEELMLIQANSATRVLTSAEIARQAERVEVLVYKLKEQGYEFPGRMRDYVAAMCNVSATKLAKLKVIREGLCAEYFSQYNSNLISEQAAYSLARLPKDFQQRLYKLFPGIGGSDASNIAAKYIDNGWRWEPQQSCPDGSTCKRGDSFLRHDVDCLRSEMCGGNKCCMKCPLGKAKNYACNRACSKVQALKKKEREEKAEAEKECRAKREKKLKKEIMISCSRLVSAADAAGLSDDSAITISYRKYDLRTIRKYADGDFGDRVFYANDFSPYNISNFPELCKKLCCSADYIAGFTDELKPLYDKNASASDGLPSKSGLYAAKFECEGYVMRKLAYYDKCLQKFYFDASHGRSIEATCIGWIRLPEEF